MFCFFKNDELVDFWANEKEDCFFDLTCKSMRWQKQEIDLVYYENLLSVPSHYEIDQNKVLTIKSKNVVSAPALDENGNQILDIETGKPSINETVSYTIDRILDPDFYVTKGNMIKPC